MYRPEIFLRIAKRSELTIAIVSWRCQKGPNCIPHPTSWQVCCFSGDRRLRPSNCTLLHPVRHPKRSVTHSRNTTQLFIDFFRESLCPAA